MAIECIAEITVPASLISRAAQWDSLRRWEKRELGQALRRLGLSYSEIASIIPVTKGTLSGWCRDIVLGPEQQTLLLKRRPSVEARIRAGNRRREGTRIRVAKLRAEAADEAVELSTDPLWVSGVVACWAEGAKRCNEIVFSNSDPRMIRLFVSWSRRYLGARSQDFVARMHLHDGQSESERRDFWTGETGILPEQFRSTFFKPEGTGHRKNLLYNGTLLVRLRRSTNQFHRVMGWIDGLSRTLYPGR